MNIKSLSLSIIAVSALSIAVSQSANAQNARFDYDKNTWAADKVAPHHRYCDPAPAAVQAGSVPHSSLFAPPAEMLARPAIAVSHTFAPQAAPQVQARMMTANAAPKMLPQVPQAFQAAFGKPLAAQPPVMASLPQSQPAMAQPATTAPGKLPPAAHPSYNNNLNGRLLRKHIPTAQSATAAPLPVATYGGQHFSATPWVQAASTGSSSVNTAVSGVIVGGKHR
jgi:hypothetical protein